MNSNTETIDVIQDLYDKDGFLDILLEVEKYFDNMDLYAYTNWINGIVVEGPIVEKYWVTVILKYTKDIFPDVRGLLLFENTDTKIQIKRDFEKYPIPDPRSENEMSILSTGSGSVKKPKEIIEPILLVKFQIPRTLVTPESFDEFKRNNNQFDSNIVMGSTETTDSIIPTDVNDSENIDDVELDQEL